MNLKTFTRNLLVAALALTLSSCGSPPPVEFTVAEPGDTTQSSCGEGHTWFDGSAPYWTYVDCGASSNKFIDQSTVGASGEALGSRSVQRGKITFSSTGTHNWDIAVGTDTFSLLVHAQGHNGHEVNWHWHSYNLGAVIESRLTAQRFDGTCSGFCEDTYITQALQYFSTEEVYDWDCSWDSGGTACTISRDGNLIVQTATVPTGYYGALNYIGVGTGALRGPYPDGKFIISNLRVSFFQ
jgi:hypothetical protein